METYVFLFPSPRIPSIFPLSPLFYQCVYNRSLWFYTFQVDVKQVRKPVVLLQWMGMNALIIYVLAACEIFSGFLQGFYLGSPENNLVTLIASMQSI